MPPITTTHFGEFYVDEHTEHWFALDHAGDPGFLSMDFVSPEDHTGTYYAFCQPADAHACTDGASWDERRISEQNLVRGALVCTQANQARFLTEYSPDDYARTLAYVKCDATCAELRFVELWDTDGYAHWSLRLDHADRPRVTLYSGWYVSDIPSRTVFYVWCNTTCLDQASWQTRALSPQAAAAPLLDMQLDAQDRPRMVFNTSYAWCTASCESPGGTWQAKVVETSTTLNALYPVPVPSDCTEST